MTLDQIPGPRAGGGGPVPAEREPDSSTGRTAAATRATWYRRLRRPWVVIPVVLVVGLAVWLFAIRSDDSASTATGTTTTKQLVTVTRGTLTNSVSAEGTVAAAQTDDLDFSSSGTVTAVNVKAGDPVTAGEVLATIDSASLQSAVAAAASTLAKAQASLSDDQASGASSAQVAADQTAVTTATDSLARAWQNLAGASLVATFNGTVSSVNLTVGEQLASSGSGGTTPTGSGSGSGQSSSTLGSGSSGGFGGNNSSSSGSSSTPQIEVVSKGAYTVSLPVGSSDVSAIKAGDTATLTVTTATGGGRFGGGGGFRALFAAGGFGGTGTGGGGTGGTGRTGTGQNGTGAAANTGATATGTVTAVGQVASASSGVAQYPVTVTFSTDNAQFSVGSTVTGAVQAVVANDVLQVPLRAISTDSNGDTTVTVALDGKTNGRTATRTVKTGRTAGGMIEITSGLQEGDQVIVTTVVPTGLTTNGTGTGGRGTFGGNGQFPGLGGAGTGTGSGNAQVVPKGAG